MLSDEVFKQVFDMIEKVIGNKYTQEERQIYKMLLNDLTDEELKEYTYTMLKDYSYTWLPKPANIYKYKIEKDKAKKELEKQVLEKITTEKYVKIRNQIEQMAKNVTTKKYICDEPLTHKIVDILGGIHKLGMYNITTFDILMNTTLKDLVKQAVTQKIENMPLTLGSREKNATLVIVGNEDDAKRWLNAYGHKKNILENGIYITDVKELLDILETSIQAISNNKGYKFIGV